MPLTRDALPRYDELMLPALRAVVALGGSASSRQVVDRVIEAEGFTDEQIEIRYDNRDQSILVDRIAWARSYCKLGGALESPKRGLLLVTPLGEEISQLPDGEAIERLRELDRDVRRRRKKAADHNQEDDEQGSDLDAEDDESWKADLLARLHRLSPDAFERFTLYVLRSYGMELTRQGGTGDEGIDGIGTAPLTEILTRTVAVQAKRYEPSKTIGREVVALFQSDASAKGAEHGVLVTTARFSKPAQLAALGRTPTIDLVDGDRLAELCLQREIGVSTKPVVDSAAFDRFETDQVKIGQ